MKVKDLIRSLETQDPEAEVRMSYDYGDYVHTMVAAKIRGVEEMTVKYSQYHNEYRVTDDDEEVNPDDYRTAVVLS